MRGAPAKHRRPRLGRPDLVAEFEERRRHAIAGILRWPRTKPSAGARSMGRWKPLFHREVTDFDRDYDPKHALDGFETLREARERRDRAKEELRGTWLDRYDTGIFSVFLGLTSCRRRWRCESMSCPVCMRQFRRWYISEGGHLLHTLRPRYFVTLIPARMATPRGELDRRSLQQLKSSLRSHLRRGGLGRAVVIGAVDISLELSGYDDEVGYWQPHFHVVIAGTTRKEIGAALRPLYPRSDEVRRPVRVDKVRNLIRQHSYTYKPFFQRYVTRLNARGHRRRRARRLTPDQFAELAVYLNDQDFGDRMFLQNVRRRGHRLVCTLR